jgi:hypothetical protein
MNALKTKRNKQIEIHFSTIKNKIHMYQGRKKLDDQFMSRFKSNLRFYLIFRTMYQ